MRRPALPNPHLWNKPRFIGYPEPGFFVTRLVRHGPLVPAIIWQPCPWIEPGEGPGCPGADEWCRPIDRSRPLRARIGDTEVSPHEVWERGSRVSAAEHAYRTALQEWAATHAPEAPEARANEPVNLNTMESLY